MEPRGVMKPIETHEHGTSGPTVVVLHGGPGAPGSATDLARGLARWFRVLEPWQRGSGGEPLTVARHVADLHDLMEARFGGAPAPLVGESWGAMLALAYAAEHPATAGPLVLVGCGTFDAVARARLRVTLNERTDDELRRRLESLPVEVPDPTKRLERRYELMRSLYHIDLLPDDGNEGGGREFDMRAYSQSWSDMVRLQREGVYPAAFEAIESPVLMLHGAYDPHPGQMIRANLEHFLPQLEYQEWERSGHTPWREAEVRHEFFAVAREWLMVHQEDAE
jgi:pimeloyl-ACP methyl ester carboxylesterase